MISEPAPFPRETAVPVSPYRAAVARRTAQTISGHVYDPRDLTIRLILELLVDGIPVALARAETFVDSLHRTGIGDGCYGFSFVLAPEVLQGGRFAQVVVANLRCPLAPPIALQDPSGVDSARDESAGEVVWHGGLQLTGWLNPQADPAAHRVRLTVDGDVVAEGPADRWHHQAEVGGARPVPAFNLHLPARFADGRTRRVSVTNGLGTPLRGSPITLLALPDPLEAAAARIYGPDSGVTAARARLFDRLLPHSLPLTELDSWLVRYPPPAAARGRTRIAVVLIGDDPVALARSLDSLEAQPKLDWVAGVLPSNDRIGFRSEDLRAFLASEAAEYPNVLVAPAGAVFLPGAPERLAAALAEDPAARLVYGDLALGPSGAEAALAFPAFDYERWLEQGYGALLFALPSTQAAQAAQGGANSLYRLASAGFGSNRPRDILHLPGIAARLSLPDLGAAARHLAAATQGHLATRGIAAQVQVRPGTILPAIRVSRPIPSGLVSVIVPTRDRADLLRSCLNTISPALGRVPSELIVVDNGSSDPDTHAIFEAVRRSGGQVLTEPGPFNYAHLCNRAATVARGQFLLLLNNDIEVAAEGWLEELLSRLADPEVDAVGAVLRWPSDVIQHGGIVLGPAFSAGHAFDDRLAQDAGYGDLLRVAHEPSAVTGACLLVRRDAYQAVGGMDAHRFPVNFNDVDLCLKLAARDRAVVLTPHVQLMHRASASRGRDVRRDQVARYERELSALRARWGGTLADDPAYSPLLAVTDNPYTALACPPRGFAPRRRASPKPRAMPTGL